jgi:competence protein ComEC
MLIDAGASQAGRAQTLAEVLWERHVDTVEAAVLSHMDQDHVNFLPYLHRRFTIDSAVIARARPLTPFGRTVRRWLRRADIAQEEVLDGDSLSAGPLVATVLHPGARFAAGGAPSENARSLVLRCSYGGLSFLFPGDVESHAVRRLLTEHADRLKADVLVLPHHGHYHAGLDGLLAAVQPRVALASTTKLAPETRKLLRRRGIPVWTTGRDGAIIVQPRDDSFTVRGWKSGRAAELPLDRIGASSGGGAE